MKIHTKMYLILAIMMASLLLVTACSNLNPAQPQTPVNPPAGQLEEIDGVRITYNYDDTSKVQLSNNNVVLKVGQKLVLQPAPGLTKNTRFTSSGENFWGDVMTQDPSQPGSDRVTFTATKPGKGRLQIIPNTNDVNRATDLWVTVQEK